MKKLLLILSAGFFLLVGFGTLNLNDQLSGIIQKNRLKPAKKPTLNNSAKIELGRMLFFDPILSGNRDISCATCHHPGLNSGDNLSLAIGVGGKGLGESRKMGQGRDRIPRNSPEIFNRGDEEWQTMFWDSRVSGSLEKGFHTPADEKLPGGLENILAVQAMFPVTSRDEMRGEIGDHDIEGNRNELALISNAKPQSVWLGIMKRLMAIPEYDSLFKSAYPKIEREKLGFQYAANAIAAFEMEAFTFEESPWDKFLGGDRKALNKASKRGAVLFFEKANCATCHVGNLFTDQEHHNLGVPQFGPGKDNARPLDVGRFAETGKKSDRFAFRTPPLRNVTITGPWMHNGAYTSLEEVIKHHLNPGEGLRNYEAEQLPPELRATYKGDKKVIEKIISTIDPELKTQANLNQQDIQDLMAFLGALTDPEARNLNNLIPEKVPSGLPVEVETNTEKEKGYGY